MSEKFQPGGGCFAQWIRNALLQGDSRDLPGGRAVKNPLAKQETRETWVWSLSREAPQEKEMETHLCILAWRIPWTEELGGLQPMESQRVGHNWAAKQPWQRLTQAGRQHLPGAFLAETGELPRTLNTWHFDSDFLKSVFMKHGMPRYPLQVIKNIQKIWTDQEPRKHKL